MLNQKPIARTSTVLAIFLALASHLSLANAQNLEEIRWKSADKVRAVYGEPQNVRGPIGTHASYTLWSYDGFVVAFSNEKAFHLFKENSEKSPDLNEDRSAAETN